MATIGLQNLAKYDIYTSAHAAVAARRSAEYMVVTGCDVHQKSSPGMGVTVDAGTIKYNGTVTAVAGGDVVITAADATYPRFDIIYVDSSGNVQVVAGTPEAIAPLGETTYSKFSAPSPNASIPTGVILARVYVAANASSILNASIDDIAFYGKDNYPLKADFTAKGSMLVATAASTPANFSIGTNDLALVADSSHGSGMRWKAPIPATHATYHVTGGSDVIANAVPAGNAGLMSGADKTKLDGLQKSDFLIAQVFS